MFDAMLQLRAAGKSFSPITLKGMLPNDRIADMTVAQYMSRLMAEAVGYLGIPDWCAAITAAAAPRDLHSLADDLRQIAFEEELKISRAEEVMYGWLLDHVKDEDRRVLLGKWSMFLAAPHVAGSFRDFCKETGRIRRTAERHLQNEFTRIFQRTN